MLRCACWQTASSVDVLEILRVDIANAECAATCEIPRRKTLIEWINLDYE